MAFSCESANLLPVGDKFIFLQQNLGGVLWMCLLQTFCITAKCVNLVQQKTYIML